MATLTAGQIYTLARNAGLPMTAAALAAAVALAESGGRTDAVGDVGLQDGTWGPSIGLWQIRSLKAQTGTGQPRDASRLTDPAFNAASMASISGMGKNFDAWTTYKNGAYKKYVATTEIAAGASQLGPLGGLVTGAADAAGITPAVSATAGAVDGLASGWSKEAMAIALKVLAAATAAGLVIVGAVHTVSSK